MCLGQERKGSVLNTSAVHVRTREALNNGSDRSSVVSERLSRYAVSVGETVGRWDN